MNSKIQILKQRDQLCDRFEKIWETTHPLSVEKFLEMEETRVGQETIDELIMVEVELRHAHQLPLSRQEFDKRFPDQSNAVSKAFDLLAQAANAELATSHHDMSSIQPAIRTAKDIPKQIGEFQLLRLLGSGAFGVVYKAQHVPTGEIRALKFPKWQTISTLEELLLLKHEAEIASELDHPALVRSLGAFDVDGYQYNESLSSEDHLVFSK